MTFSVVARCPRTGMFGGAIATRPIAIGAKCPFLKAGVGALVVQANGDPDMPRDDVWRVRQNSEQQ